MKDELLKKVSEIAKEGKEKLPKWLLPEALSEAEAEMNETRYVKLVKESKVPVYTLLKTMFDEDKVLFLPRVLSTTIRTLNRIPRTLFMKASPQREQYIFDTFKTWSSAICKLVQVRLKIVGADKIDPAGTYLFASNHRSPADIPLLYESLPVKAAFVANGIVGRIPIFSYWMKASGAVFVEQGNPKAEEAAFKAMIKRLRHGRNLILFPEGYIHQGAGVGEFKRGGLHAALLANVPIVPVCLSNTEKVMRAGSLYIAPRQNVTVEFGEPIVPATMSRKEKKYIDFTLRAEIAAMKEKAAGKNPTPLSIEELRDALRAEINKLA